MSIRTNEVAERGDEGTLEVFPPAQAHRPTAVAMLMEHAEVYNTAWKLAGQLVQTTMVPKRFFKKQGDATAAILYGAELGLNPIQSLQRVIPIHGMPSLEARTMVGLLKAAGYRIRTKSQSDESVTVEGEAPDGETYTSTWTIGRAKLAGYVPTPVVENPDPNKESDWLTVTKSGEWGSKTSILGNMKYVTDPQTMLKAKAQAETCRELAPDVLMGISYSREELESEDQRQFDRDADKPRVTREVAIDDILTAEEVPIPTPASAEDPDNPTDNPRPAAEQPQAAPEADPAPDAPETPAGAVDEDQAVAPDPDPAPAEPVVSDAQVKQAAADREAKAESAKISKARSTAPAADPERPKSRMRKALEKRLFALTGDAGLNGDKDRDGRLALYRAVLENDSIESTDDLDDTAVGKVADVLYQWQQQSVLDDEVAAILSAAVAGETTAPATADVPTTEGTE